MDDREDDTEEHTPTVDDLRRRAFNAGYAAAVSARESAWAKVSFRDDYEAGAVAAGIIIMNGGTP